MGDTSIEWTNKTWNPIRGCSVVSEGCRNCYAMNFAARFAKEGEPYEGLAYRNESGAHWTGKVRFVEEHLTDPLHWKKPRRIFVNSMSDLFHESLSQSEIATVFAVMALSPQHIFQVLTKRAARAARIMQTLPEFIRKVSSRYQPAIFDWPLPNVWLGVSVEDQKTADERIPLLLQTPAAVRWISAEPLLSPIDLGNPKAEDKSHGDWTMRIQRGLFGIDWVVVGGESGNGARPFDIEWARSIINQCRIAEVPVFVKQLGAKPYHRPELVSPNRDVLLRLSNKKGGDISEWPKDLQVREFPAVNL